MMVDCPTCGAPADHSSPAEFRGVDFDGKMKTFYYARWICAAGHRWTQEVEHV